ncbi:MAG: S9 family peptidase [Bacteroidetes bacterium]|nr:S9 family peptidase [Bacteroidota bacterium]
MHAAYEQHSVSELTQPAPVTIADFFDLRYVGAPQISPDGAWIAYTVRQTDTLKQSSQTRIWMAPAGGGDPLPMTAAGSSASNPRWSPDGKYLSFTATRGDGAKNQVWVLDRRGGEAQQLTFVEQGVSGYEWSPDGSRLLLLIRDADEDTSGEPRPYVIDRLQFKRDYIGYLDRRRIHIYTFTPGDDAPVQLTFGDYDHSSPVWSPDGTRIAFVSNRTDEPDGNIDSNIWVVQSNCSEADCGLVQVTRNPGPDTQPAWSPDGREIAYITNIEPDKFWYATTHLAITSADGSGPERVLTREIDRNMGSPRFSRDGRSILFLKEEGGMVKLSSIGRDGRRFTNLIEGTMEVNSFAIQGDLIAASIGNFSAPDEIYTLNRGRLSQLTFTNREYLARIETASFREIRFPSKGGTEIHGFMVLPNGYQAGQRYPTILWIHGGPVAQYSHSYNFNAQLFAANGYVVLMINPRGSSGYGQAFSEILFADWGNKDFEDVMAGVDYAIENGYADPNHLGVGGWSYGGILTNYVITKTDRFHGAISGSSETLMRSNYGHDHYQLFWEKELGLPWETPEKWERISPFNDVANVVTPTLWIGGAEDWNVPILGSEQMYQAMRRLGVETLLVVYPGEHHGISRPAFQKDRFERYLDWFNRYVKNR